MCSHQHARPASVKHKRQRDPEVAIKKWIPLTYQPKISKVLSGEITQTIRVNSDLLPADWIAFHGWSGRPYRSPWSFRTPYLDVIIAEPIFIFEDGIAFEGSTTFHKIGDPMLNRIAWLDGIDPATGQELISVLHKMNGPGTLKGKIITWDPKPLNNMRRDVPALSQ